MSRPTAQSGRLLLAKNPTFGEAPCTGLPVGFQREQIAFKLLLQIHALTGW